jgi:tripartite-type tricarboxylate transporter receptor subunit TctC
MLAPAATPKEIVQKLADEVVKAVQDPKFSEQLTLNGVDGHAEGSARFAAMIAEEIPVWAEAVEIAGVKLK